MRVFVTGASGWIGSSVVPELLAAGHQVLGLARSDESAAAIERAGAEVHRGSLDDLASLRAGAEKADAVVHLAFIHDFANFGASVAADRAAIEAFGDVLAGSDRALFIASGFGGLPSGATITENDRPGPDANPRLENARLVLELADRGIRAGVLRYAPTVHGAGDHGFMAALVQIARDRGVSGYIGDGANRWPAVHVSDAGRLTALAVDKAPAGSILHGVAEQGVPVRTVAEVIGHKLELPVRSVPAAEADAHFGWLARFLAMDAPASSEITRERMGWTPTGPTLLEDLESGAYTG